MKYKKGLMLICLMICLFAISSAAAGDVNQTDLSSDDAGHIELSAYDKIVEDNLHTDNGEIVDGQYDLSLGSNSSTYSQLYDEIGSGGNIELKHDYYIYDAGSTINISVDNSVIDGKSAVIDMTGSNVSVFYITASNVTIKNLTFKNIHYDGYGGAIAFMNGGYAVNCSFVNNFAKYGGAIYSYSNSTIIKNCIFLNNTVSAGGGAIYCCNDSLVIEKCIFDNNTAQSLGGAIYTEVYMMLKDCIFRNNSAREGGAVYLFCKNGEIDNCLFMYNSAGSDGGAIYTFADLELNGCIFMSNYAEKGGGALYSAVSSNKVVDCTFKDNSADSGGAIYSYLYRNEIINSSFINNSALNEGGSICGNNLFINDTNFLNNSALGGGAISSSGSEVKIFNTNFTSNNALSFGGAIFSKKALYSFVIDESNFINNVAGVSAGAIYSINSANFFSNSTFINCSSSLFGGAICDLKSSSSFVNLKFYSNSAYRGGAIYKFYKTAKIAQTEFSSNSACEGGAIYVNTITSCDLKEALFDNNTADFGNDLYSDYTNNSAITGYDGDFYNLSSLNLTISSDDYLVFKNDDADVNISVSRYDLRDYGLVTPAKNQMKEGNCWAFASIAALESCIIRANSTAYNFSEQNMKNLAGSFSEYGSFFYETNEGIDNWFDIDYLVSWMGPVFEESDIYSSNVLSLLFCPSTHIQNVLFIKRDSPQDLDGIKKAIMKYGAVATTMFYTNLNLAADSISYYCDTKKIMPNHGVTIVGWDDNYNHTKFSKSIDKDGAFIVKNSYGSDWGEDGYFYVSYYDEMFARNAYFSDFAGYTFILNDTNHYEKIYQNQLFVTDTLDNNESAMFKNIFKAEGDEMISAVSTYFYGDYDYEVFIEVNGESRHNQSGSLAYGYYTIPLTKSVPIKEGDLFEVIFKFSSKDGSPVSIAVFEGVHNSRLSSSNSFFKSENDSSWYNPVDVIVAIKAFTNVGHIKKNTAISAEAAVSGNVVTLTVNVDDNASGFVEFNITENVVYVAVNEGKAVYSVVLPNGNYTASVRYMGDEDFNTNSTSENFTVFHVVAKVTEFTDIIVSGDYVIAARLVDSEGSALTNTTVKYTIGDAVFSTITDDDGGFTINAYKNCAVFIEFAGNSTLLATNISIKLEEIASEKLASKFNVSNGVSIKSYAVDTPAGEVGRTTWFLLTDSNGNPIANAAVQFAYKTVILNRTTDENGIVFIGINTQVAQEALCAMSYLGDEKHNATFVAFSYDIQKKPITISAAAKTYKASAKTKKYTVTLKTKVCNSRDGKVYLSAGKKVTMKINGKVYTTKINAKGQATFSLKITKKGKFSAKISFAGDKTYASASKSVKITIK